MVRWFKINGAAAFIVVLLLASSGSIFSLQGNAGAQERKFGPTPSLPGAAVYFIDLKDDATIPTTSVIHFGLKKMGVAPAGSDRPNTGHHHLLIDTELPPFDEPIPSDFNHLHFGAGQTEVELTLTPGPHTLQLLLGDKNHIPHNPPVLSERIRVFVVDSAVPQPAAQAAPAVPPPPPESAAPQPTVQAAPAVPPPPPESAAPQRAVQAAPPVSPLPPPPVARSPKPSAAGATTTSASAPPKPAPFVAALAKAANDLFSNAPLGQGAQRALLVIDPLVDGVTGAQSVATQLEQKTIVQLVRDRYPRFEIAPFDAASLAGSPVVLIGTFTAINNAGLSSGPRDAYRICLVLADLRTNTIISKSVARAAPEGVNVTPTAFFTDSPVFAKDPLTEGYIKSCQATKVGDPINQLYADRILASSLVSEAIEAYETKRYQDALDLYRSALRAPGGDQLRALNGIYLSETALHHSREAKTAFARVIDYGLSSNAVAVKLFFQPGSTEFIADPRKRAVYPLWLQTIAERAAAAKSCLEVVGHTSATGFPALNDRLSVLRAEAIKDRLGTEVPDLRQRLLASGRGSHEMIVGTGKDDASDALDRRVEFKVVPC